MVRDWVTAVEAPWLLLAVTEAPFPRAWIAMQMKHSEHGHEVIFNGKEHTIRKITDESPPGTLVDLRKLEWILEESRKDRIYLRFEAEAEVNTLPFVPERRFENLELGLGRNIEPPHHRAERRRARSSSRISDQGRDVISPRR